MSHNYLNKNRTQELINTIRGHLSDIATVLSNLASGDARDNTKAPINHNQPSSTITAMTGYTKPQATSAITASDTLNEAIGKLEKGLEDAGGGGSGGISIIPINAVIRDPRDGTSSGMRVFRPLRFYYDNQKIEQSPIVFHMIMGVFSYSSSTTVNVFTGRDNLDLAIVDISNYLKTMDFNPNTDVITTKTEQVRAKVTFGYPASSPTYSANYVSFNYDDTNNYIDIKVYKQNQNASDNYSFVNAIIPINIDALIKIEHQGTTIWQRDGHS